MVFIPILTMDLEVGQLFRDIAVAISVAVLLSLLVAVTLIPAMASRVLSGDITTTLARRRLPVVDRAASGLLALLVGFTRLRRPEPPAGRQRDRRGHRDLRRGHLAAVAAP